MIKFSYDSSLTDWEKQIQCEYMIENWKLKNEKISANTFMQQIQKYLLQMINKNLFYFYVILQTMTLLSWEIVLC